MEALSANNSLAPFDQLQDLNMDGVPPKTRVSTSAAARAICLNLVQANTKRFVRNARVKGMVDGNSPWPQDDLERRNQGFRSNFNTGEAEAYLDVAKSAFYDLSSETQTLATAICEYGEDVNKKTEWGLIVTEEFDKLQKGEDEDRDFNTQLSQHDMVLYGAGPQVFDDFYDWRTRAVKFSTLLVPDDAESKTSRWVMTCFTFEYKTDEMYQFIADEKAAVLAGWDVQAVKDAIIYAASNWIPLQFAPGQQWEINQQRLRNNDLWHGSMSRRVSVYRLFFREFPKAGAKDGRISECWVTQGSGVPVGNERTDKEQDKEGWLFCHVGRYESWNDIVHPFFYDKGDGTAHGVRGLGVKMYKALLSKMKLDNALVDSALARTAIMLEAENGKDFNMPQHYGPYTKMPPGHKFIQQAVGGVLDAPMAVSRELGNTLAANLSQYRARVEKPEGNPRTKYEVELNANQMNALNKTQIVRYYEQLDGFYAARYKRAANPNLTRLMRGADSAMAFQQKCIDRGVPRVALQKMVIIATRAIGQGNAQMRQQTLTMLLSTVGGSLPEQGKQALLSDYIATAAGQTMVARYNPAPAQATFKSDQEAEAWLQVSAMKNGIPPVLTGTQNHAVYATIFVQAASQAAQSVQKGANPMEVAAFLEMAGQGLAGHLQALAHDPLHKDLFAMLQNQFKTLGQFHDQLVAQIQAMQQKQAQQKQQTQAAMSADQIAQAEAASEMKRKDAKTAHDLQLKSAKAGQAAAQAKQTLAINDAKAASEIRIAQAKAASGAAKG